MGRRKKEKVQDKGIEEISEKRLSEDTKRSIFAVVSGFFAILFILGFFGIAGLVGKYLDVFAQSIFGWGKWLFPFVLSLIGIVLLRKTIRFYIISILGLGMAYIATLGFFHIFFDESSYREIIDLGKGGGYVGYGLSVGSIFLFGKVGAVVTLIVLWVIGVMVAFNASLLPLYDRLARAKSFWKRNKEDVLIEESDGERVDSGESSDVIPSAEKENEVAIEEDDHSNESVTNIRAIQFHGKDSLSENEEQYGEVQPSIKEDKKEREGNREEKQYGSYELSSGESSRGKKWVLPPLDILKSKGEEYNSGDTEHNRVVIQETLRQFGIEVEAGGEKFGPTVTQYMFRPAAGVKLERITALSNNLAMALSAQSIRIEAPIPGKSLVGIEVPNRNRGTVCLREILESDAYRVKNAPLLVPLGKNVSGDVELGNLEKMPHLLIAGTTGSGKSVCINAILTTLLYQNTPEQLQLILVDPKRVELSLYNGIPHLKSDVIVENKKVLGAIKWAVGEMERRYEILQKNQSRNIGGYNERVIQQRKRGVSDLPYMPYLVIVIDELADLMGSHGKDVEGAIARIAQMARAVGIHLIIATQRPDVHVLTGLIKTNISTRISFRVPTQIDSRTILDKGGAEKLLGLGDMLFIDSTNPSPIRIQGVYLSTKEVKRVVYFWKKQDEEKRSTYGNDGISDEEAEKSVIEMGDIEKKVGSFQEKLNIDELTQGDTARDSLFAEAKDLVERVGKASTSLIQRHLRIGYNRAARIIDELEAEGVVGPQDGAKPRDVYNSKNISVTPTASSDSVSYEDPLSDEEKREKWER